MFTSLLGAPTTFISLQEAVELQSNGESLVSSSLPSDVMRLLVIDDLDRDPDFEKLELMINQLRDASAPTRAIVVGEQAPSYGDWYRLDLSPLTTDAVFQLLTRVPGLNPDVVQRTAVLTEGSPLLAQMIGNRIQLTDGPATVDEILRGLSWDERRLLPGVVSPAVASRLDIKVQAVNDALIQRLAAEPELMYQLRPRQLEQLMADLYAGEGFEVTLTPETRDGGADLYLVQHTAFGQLLTIVDCKRNRADRPIGVGVVRQMLGTIDQTGASAGVLATTSRFTSGAVQLGQQYPFRLGLQDYFDLHSMLRRAVAPS
jgi:restriction system protein